MLTSETAQDQASSRFPKTVQVGISCWVFSQGKLLQTDFSRFGFTKSRATTLGEQRQKKFVFLAKKFLGHKTFSRL